MAGNVRGAEMNKSKPVKIEFLDHAMCDGTAPAPAKCTAIGFLIKEDKEAYYLCTWSADGCVTDENSEYIVIVKHPGMKVTVLK